MQNTVIKVFFVIVISALILMAVNCVHKDLVIRGQEITIKNREEQILLVKSENQKLKEKQSNLDWFYSELETIDNYIVWEKKLMANYKGSLPEIDTTFINYQDERSKVIAAAIKFGGD